eukprot:scaffold6265_cov193-Cylindrotheca_fusiformis.AAC.14
MSNGLALSNRKQECISQIAGHFQELEDEEESSNDKSPVVVLLLCKLHDELLQIVSQDDPEWKDVTTDMLRLRLLENKEQVADHIQTYIIQEADLYRAVSLTSLYLMEYMPLVLNQPLVPEVENSLQSSFEKSQCLFQILETIQRQLPNNDDSTVPTEHSILDEWLYRLIQSERRNDVQTNKNNRIISFDREKLQMEEDELLQMAATPVPPQQQPNTTTTTTSTIYGSIVTNRTDSSTARLWLTATSNDPKQQQKQVTVVWNKEQGMFRTKNNDDDDVGAKDAWWLVTCESSISYKAPNLVISAVITNTPSYSIIPSLTLDIGTTPMTTDASVWWEQISKVVVKLQERKELQDQLGSLWTSDQVEARVKEAQIEVSAKAIDLN